MRKGIFFLFLLLLSLWDVKERRVPVSLLVVGSVAVGCIEIYCVVTGRVIWLQPVLGSLPGVLLVVIAWLSQKAGYADGIVLLWMGISQGYREGLLIMCISLMLIFGLSVVLLLLHKVKKHSRIPYIPFLTAGFVLVELMNK